MKLFHRPIHEYRILFPLVIAFCGLGCALLLYSNQTIKENDYLASKLQTLNTAYEASIQAYRLAMEGFFWNSSETLALFAEGASNQGARREQAIQALGQTLNASQEAMKRLNLLQLHYHLADGASYLRFPHANERRGEQPSGSRSSLSACNSEHRIVQGIQADPLFLAFRYVLPLSRQGRHLGCVEADVAFKSILSALKMILPWQEYAYIINKRRLASHLVTDQNRVYTPSTIHDEYLTENGAANLQTSPAPLSSSAKVLNLLLKQDPSVQSALQKGGPLAVALDLSGTTYTVSLLPLYDVDAQVFGYLIAYAADPLVAKFRRDFYLMLLATISVFVLILALVCRLHQHTRTITDERRKLGVINEVLRLNEETGRKLTMAVEQSPISVLITDATGAIEYANRQFVQTSGYSLEEVMGKNPRLLRSGQMPESVYNEMWDTIASGKAWKGELLNQRKDGQLYWSSVFISPVRDNNEVISHFIATLEDVTEQKQIKETLRENETLHRTLVESLPVGLVIIDNTTKVIEEINPMGATMFGAQRNDIVGASCQQFLCPATINTCPADAATSLCDNSERIMLRADGSRIPILKTIRKITIKGQPKLLECFVNIQERKKIEEALHTANRELEEASRAKSRFLADMSHEIRTPMNAIIGMTHLAMQTGDDQQRRQLLATVQDAANNLLGLLNDILDFSKMEGGHLQLNLIPFSLPALIDEVLATLRLSAEQKNIQLRAQVADPIPTCLMGDDLRLRQIFINLIGNAIKFTSNGSVTIKIDLEPESESEQGLLLHFVVSDTGTGIAPDKLSAIFNSFEQADANYARQQSGTGLGLSICKQLVGLMGGRIWAESTLNQGSDFHVLIRMGQCEAPPHLSPAPTPPTTTKIEGLRILLVDDNEVNRDVARLLLEEEKQLVTTAENGLAALETLAGAEFDLVLMDVQMPILDGMTTTRIIRAVEGGGALMIRLSGEQDDQLIRRLRGGHLRIVAMTAHAMDSDRDLCLSSGMDDCITKPFPPEKLLQVLTAQAQSAEAPAASGPAPETQPARQGQPTEEPEPATEQPAALGLEQITDHFRQTTPLTEEQIGHILKAARTSMSNNLAQAEQALSANDQASLGRAAHTLKGTLLQCGLKTWADKAQEIHTGVRENRELPFAEMVAALREALTPLL